MRYVDCFIPIFRLMAIVSLPNRILIPITP